MDALTVVYSTLLIGMGVGVLVLIICLLLLRRMARNSKKESAPEAAKEEAPFENYAPGPTVTPPIGYAEYLEVDPSHLLSVDLIDYFPGTQVSDGTKLLAEVEAILKKNQEDVARTMGVPAQLAHKDYANDRSMPVLVSSARAQYTVEFIPKQRLLWPLPQERAKYNLLLALARVRRFGFQTGPEKVVLWGGAWERKMKLCLQCRRRAYSEWALMLDEERDFIETQQRVKGPLALGYSPSGVHADGDIYTVYQDGRSLAICGQCTEEGCAFDPGDVDYRKPCNATASKAYRDGHLPRYLRATYPDLFYDKTHPKPVRTKKKVSKKNDTRASKRTG